MTPCWVARPRDGSWGAWYTHQALCHAPCRLCTPHCRAEACRSTVVCMEVQDLTAPALLPVRGMVCCLQCNCFCALLLLLSFHLELTHIRSKAGMVIRGRKTCYQEVCFPIHVKILVLSILTISTYPNMITIIFLGCWPYF